MSVSGFFVDLLLQLVFCIRRVIEPSFLDAMLGTRLNSRFEAKEFSPFSIITLEKYVCSEQGPPNGEKLYEFYFKVLTSSISSFWNLHTVRQSVSL